MHNLNIKRFDERRLREIALHIAKGLITSEFHEKGIIHHNLNPEAILMSDETTEALPVISDFG